MWPPVVQLQWSSTYPTVTYPAPVVEPGLTLRLSHLACCCCCQSRISHQHREVHDSHTEGGPVMSITWDVTRHNCCTILLPFDVAPDMVWMQPETRQCGGWVVYCTPSTYYTGSISHYVVSWELRKSDFWAIMEWTISGKGRGLKYDWALILLFRILQLNVLF